MTAAEFLTRLGETSLSVSLLIAIVLLARRAVARRWGSEAAFLLWLAPVTRLLAPRIILPNFVAPHAAAETFAAAPVDAFIVPLAAPATELPAAALNLAPIAAPALLALWAGGALLFLAADAFRQWRFRRWLTISATPAPQELLVEARAVAFARGYKRNIKILVAADETGPLVVGLVRPLVVVPHSFMAGFSCRERQMAFAHEFAHLARGDLWAALAATIFRAAQWFNPFVHAAWRAFRADQEAACDAHVLRRAADDREARSAYASALYKAARAASPAYVLSMSINLKERLVLMKRNLPAAVKHARLIVAALALSGVAATASYGAAPAKPAAADKDQAAEKIRAEERQIIILNDKDAPAGDKTVKKVFVFRGDGKGDLATIDIKGDGPDGDKRTLSFVDKDAGSILTLLSDDGGCLVDGDKAGKPLIDEKSEKSEGKTKIVTRTVICGKNANADPKAQAETLKKALSRMREEAKQDAERREKVLTAIEAKIAELEKNAK